ncbi:MAG: endonuclease MutS2 [Flavobacteriales bacterium]
MQSIHKDLKKELEFDQILDLLCEKSQSPKNQQFFKSIQAFSSFSALKTSFQTLENYGFAREDSRFPSFQYQNLQKSIKLLKIENASLDAEDFFAMLLAIDFSNKAFRFFKSNPEHYSTLERLFENLNPEKALAKRILEVFTPQKELRDKASDALFQIRAKLKTCSRLLSQQFNRALSHCEAQGFLADIKETYIDHTRVLAISAEHKRKVKGRRLGESNTGAVAYIEPQDCAILNREWYAHKADEKEEVRRILLALTNEFRDRLAFIKALTRLQEQLDRLEAKTQLGHVFEAVIPKLSQTKSMTWKDAYHPLLLQKYKDERKRVHPQDMSLNEEQFMVVISGPNAGGKSISLKTVGLLQIMFQCGLKVPVHPDSVFCLFDAIFTDIGDNQSIENELSTYSHRLNRMREILDESSADSMILIDEFGSGSDPILGAALAAVFFEELHQKQAFSVLTTHYGNIKLMAEQMEGIQNASMLFDEKNFKPLYKLQIGRPGSSFTFEVAQNMGIDTQLIKRAKEKVSIENMKYEELINQYQKLNLALEKEKHKLRKKTKRTHTLKKEFDEKLEKLDGKAKRLDDQVEHQQKHLILGRKMEKIILQYKKNKQTKQLFQQFKRLVVKESNLPEEVLKTVKSSAVFKERKSKEPVQFQIGDVVNLVGKNTKGQVLIVNKSKITVAFGALKTQIDASKLELFED